MRIGQAVTHFAHSAYKKVKSTFNHAKQFVTKKYNDHYKMSDGAAGRYGSYGGRMG